MDMSQHASLAETKAVETPASSRAENRRAGVIFALIALAVAGLAVSGYFFGIPGVAMPALASVPVIFLMLILIARG